MQLMFVLSIFDIFDYSKHGEFNVFIKQIQVYRMPYIYATILQNLNILCEFLIGYLDLVLIQELDD